MMSPCQPSCTDRGHLPQASFSATVLLQVVVITAALSLAQCLYATHTLTSTLIPSVVAMPDACFGAGLVYFGASVRSAQRIISSEFQAI
ncbi:hypothetical protein V8C86DRAFT_2817160 [Haematococcus lacustris]